MTNKFLESGEKASLLLIISMCTGRTDFDVTKGRLQNEGYFQKVYCNTVVHRFYIMQHQRTLFLHNLWCCNTYS